MNAIEVKGVRKTFRIKGGLLGADRHVVAVDDVSFAVPKGGVLGVVDGFPPQGLETEADTQARKDFLRMIGYKR